MFVMFIVSFVVAAFVVGALRILAGWLLPAGAVANLDRGLDVAARGTLKGIVVVIGLGLLALIIGAALH